MALNKILEGILENYIEDFSLGDLEKNKAFEYLVNYLIIRKYDTNGCIERHDLDFVVVDEKSQMGVDAIMFFVNGKLVVSKDDINLYAKSQKIDVEIVFIQSKTEERCEMGSLLKLTKAVKNFFINFKDVTEKNDNVLNAKEIYEELFKYKNSKYFINDSPKCIVYYATAASDENIKDITNHCVSEEKEMKELCTDIKKFNVKVLGRSFISNTYREINNRVSATIYFKNCLTLDTIEGVREAYIGYLSGKDFLNLITDQNGDLRKNIFYENVRDYQGIDNVVNSEIRDTINDWHWKEKFVLLNNGVTIITKQINMLGGNNYELLDYQIVNGCQTSNEIYNCKSNVDDLNIPIKIIYTSDSDIISKIVKATNRQSPVPDEAFVALEEFHKDLQQLFESLKNRMPLGLIYERRSGEGQGNSHGDVSKYQIFTLHGVIRSITAVYFRDAYVVYNNNPANILKTRKEKLFRNDHVIEAYYISVYLVAYFDKLSRQKKIEKLNTSFKYYYAMIVRMLMTQSIVLPVLSSNETKNETKKILNMLENDDIDGYYETANDIIKKLSNTSNYIHKTVTSSEFNKLILEEVKEYISVKE